MRFLLLAVFGFVALMVIAPLSFAFMGLVGGAMPWLIVGLIFWGMSSAFHGPRRRRHSWARGYAEPPYRPARPAYAPPPPRPMTPRPAGPVTNRLPLDIEMKAAQIKRKVEVLQQHAHEFPLGSQDLYIVRAVATDYLPRTLEAYLSLPPRGRDRVVVKDGKTALDELRGQLILLDGKLDEVAEDLERSNLDRLLANRRFLEERFARSA